MSDYIKRTDVQNALKRVNYVFEATERGVFNALARVHAADVAPVVPSKWVLLDDEERPRCAKCEHIALLETDEMYSLSNYCPNCGALMKEERTNG